MAEDACTNAEMDGDYGDLDDEQVQKLLKKLHGAISDYSQARQFQYSTFFLGFIVAAGIFFVIQAWYRGALFRSRKRRRLQRAVHALEDMNPEEIKQLFREANLDLPAWLVNPDFQRPTWVNDVIKQLWPRVGRMGSESLHEIVDEALRENSPRWITDVKLTRLTLGDSAPEISSVKVYHSQSMGQDEINIDFDFTWDSDAEAQLLIKPLPKHLQLGPMIPVAKALSNIIVLNVAVEDISAGGRGRLTLRPLLNQPPMIGAIKVSLLQAPRYNYHLTLYGGDLTLLPGVEDWLNSLIRQNVIESYMLPEGYRIPLVDNAGVADMPRGLLFVRLLEVVNVPKTDWLTKCDPYVKLWTSPKKKSRSPVQHNTYHPVWDDEDTPPFLLLVQEPDLEQLHVELWDWDMTGDERIGWTQEPIKELQQGQDQDLWLDLKLDAEEQDDPNSLREKLEDVPGKIKQHMKPKRHRGPCKVHLNVTYQPMSEEEVKRLRKGELPEDEDVADILTGGLLYVRIKKARNLKRKPLLAGGLIESVGLLGHRTQVKVTVGDEVQKSSIGRGHKREIVFDDDLEFIVPGHDANDPELSVHFEVLDYRLVDTSQGHLDIPFREIKRERRMKGTFPLEGAHQGELMLELQWLSILEAT